MSDEEKKRWAEQIRLRGREDVGSRKNLGTGTIYQGWLAALKEYDEAQRAQQEKSYEEQVAREEEAISISRKANEISEKANTRALWAITISIVSIVVSVIMEAIDK